MLCTKNVSGLITGSLNLQDVEKINPEYTIVVTEQFGEKIINPEIKKFLKSYAGKTALVDGSTQLRVGVKRPRIILPGFHADVAV